MILAGSLLFAGQSTHLDSSADRTAFRRWFTFLAESRCYTRKPMRSIADGDALARWAYGQALKRHDGSWSHSVELPLFPVMPSVTQASDEPFAPTFVSRQVDEAEPGDLLMYRRSDWAAHVMVYIGKSQILPSPKRWVVYLTAEPKQFHKVWLDALKVDLHPEWRPTAENPEFLGVWRLGLLRQED